MDLLLCGLGNPGSSYSGTRHNVGFWVVEALASSYHVPLRKRWFKQYRAASITHNHGRLVLVEPLTYMNRSGEILPELMSRYRIEPSNLALVCDTLDLPPGSCRLKRNGSSAGHRGLASVIDVIKTTEFLRFYIGIGRPSTKEAVVEHVLSVPPDDDREQISSCVERTAEAIRKLTSGPVDSVLEWYNSNTDG